jgi:FkbM family methyltransferase
MAALIYLHRVCQRYVDALGLRPLAQRVFRYLLFLRYGQDGLIRTLHNDRYWLLVPEVALRGAYAEFETVEWLRRVIKPNDTVIDVGANVGQMTLEAAHLVGPAGRVIAIEPAPGNIKILKKHISGNGFADRVTIVEAACGAHANGEITLHIFGDHGDSIGSGHNIKEPAHEGKWISIKVPLCSVDTLCSNGFLKPDVIKIDVEGAELEVLRGALQTLEKVKPQVRFGFHPFAFDYPEKATIEIRSLFATAGYNTPEPQSNCYKLEEYDAIPN